jgi:hypothetical protein
MLQASLRHLASATVSCTENQYLLHIVRKDTNIKPTHKTFD